MVKAYRLVPEPVAAAALAVPGLTAYAATPFVVEDIRIEGLRRIEPGTVFSWLPIRRGDAFSSEKAYEAIRALYATGFFNDVKIATEGGVVVVQVVERAAIGTIGFSSNHEFENDALTKAPRSVGLSQGRYCDKAPVDRAEQELKLSLGFPLVKHVGDQYQKFQFRVGTAF